MDHPDPGRAIHWVAESHQDLNHGIRHIHKEVNYKIAREDDERFKELYQSKRLMARGQQLALIARPRTQKPLFQRRLLELA